VPTYKERDNVIALLEPVRTVLTDRAFEGWVVDDDSPDETWRVAEAYAAAHPEVVVLRRRGERGLSAAGLEGIQPHARRGARCDGRRLLP
jgi:dolichol-phosphate mannosyltransferase